MSSGFAESKLKTLTEVPTGFAKTLSWTTLNAESTGITNLAQACDRTPQTNTVVAKLNATSDSETIRSFRLGYSDRVQVYLNSSLLYAGDNGYRSRDYRYMGTMGLFDEVALPLQTGENELWLVVSESFGGWGIMAAFDIVEGIEVAP